MWYRYRNHLDLGFSLLMMWCDVNYGVGNSCVTLIVVKNVLLNVKYELWAIFYIPMCEMVIWRGTTSKRTVITLVMFESKLSRKVVVCELHSTPRAPIFDWACFQSITSVIKLYFEVVPLQITISRIEIRNIGHSSYLTFEKYVFQESRKNWTVSYLSTCVN